MSFPQAFDHLKIPLQDIKSTTNNFDENKIIGRGGFGKVYVGELLLSKGLNVVAIKRLDGSFGQGDVEFWKEIMMLFRYKHEHIVSLIGFCDEGGEKILVYEYLSNKSLDLYLSGNHLSWIQRLRICIGAARGLQYLHDPHGGEHRVLHRDIKSANILLDQDWKAKISDFGLSKFGPANQEYTFLFTHRAGTFGYCDPLYVEKGYLTKESDVYSFGVVLFEVLCGRPCVQNYEDNRRFLPGLAQQRYEEKKLDTIIDNSLKDQILPKCLERFSTLAYQCLRRDRAERPSMAKIIDELELVLGCQVSYYVKQLHPSLFDSVWSLPGIIKSGGNHYKRLEEDAGVYTVLDFLTALYTDRKQLKDILEPISCKSWDDIINDAQRWSDGMFVYFDPSNEGNCVVLDVKLQLKGLIVESP